MKNRFFTVSKLVAAAICALSLGSCNRAEYAMLPKGASYHGVARAATPVPAATPATAVAPATTSSADVAPAPSVAAAPAEPATVAAPASKEVAVAPATSIAAPAALAATTPAPKLSLVQRLAVNKLTHKMEKLAQKSGTARQHNNTAATQRLEGRLRQGIILAALGILVEILGAVVGSGLIYLLGAILIIVGAVFIILYLIDKL